MKDHNPLFASKLAQDGAVSGNIISTKSMHTNIFDASKDDFFAWLFRPNEIEMAEYAQRIVDWGGDNLYFQISIYQLKDWFNSIDQDDDNIEMIKKYTKDIENLIKFCDENKIDYLIES